MVFGQRAVERDAGAKRLDRLVARVSKGRRRLEADSRSAIAEGKVGRMVELQRRGQVEACARSYHLLGVDMRLGEGGRKVDAGAGRTRGADGGDGDGFLVRGSADGDLVAYSETVHVADFDIGRAGARICREIRAVRLRADAA